MHVFQWCTVDGVQKVDWDRLDAEITKLERHFDDVAYVFSHADNQAATEFQARITGDSQCFQPILECVCCTDLLVEPAAGVQIVVDSVDAGRFELLGLRGGQQTETATNV